MIKNENGLVNVNDLKEHPLNEKLYPADKHDHQIALLGEKMDEEYKQSGVPNHTPVDYCPETGTLNSGNFRYKSALLHGWEYLRAIPGRVFDSNYDEYDEMKFLEKFNKDGKRDEYEIDSQGRFLIPNPLREYAGIQKKIILLGQGSKFELWSETIWNKKMKSWLESENIDEVKNNALTELKL